MTLRPKHLSLLSHHPKIPTRTLVTSHRAQKPAQDSSVLPTISPRWLSDIRSRIGKCIFWGLTKGQLDLAGDVMKVVARDWKDLLVGSEGFLTGRGREGLKGQEVVWGEMDSMGHVNNVQYTRYAEAGRMNWARNYATSIDPANKEEWSQLWTPNGEGLILRSIKTEYKFPMTWRDKISVYHKLRSPPTSETDSFILDAIIISEKHRRVSARCVEDIVVYDYTKGKKTSLRPFMEKALGDTFREQEEAKRRCVGKVVELLGRVEELEKGSWDRDGAKEDMGSAV